MVVERRHEMGPEGFCVCPKCGKKSVHRSGIPCQEGKCPDCGGKLLREGSHHHELYEQKQASKEKNRKEPSE